MSSTTDEPIVVAAAQTGATPAEANLLIAFTRMETKVDVVLTQHGQKLDDHELRLRKVEDRPTVSPRALWTAVCSAVAACAALLTVLDKLQPGS
jgi:hypothetical protein